MTLFRLLCVGIIIHLIFLVSIFDIYFKSPIVAGIDPEPNTLVPLGKRVVLFSVDGLRADSLFDIDPDTGEYVAKYVQNIIKNRGSWGISQSHVPTESRPGHVAMLAGFYEDPSAVTRGWKENPVDFDSIFNRSHCSFAWGSPDILNIFFKGLKHDCAVMDSYPTEQNFAGDTTKYDDWVYEKMVDYMKRSKPGRSALHDEGIFFFLHLLGQDTSGHTDKPHTFNYRRNLKNVDEIVEKVEGFFADFYGDDKTTFVFTSDHGMTDWGSHGGGDAEEINTPFVAWGAGIKTPSNSPKRIDLNQADITPLLAILLGASIPVNSLGVVPISYLNMSKRQIAQAVFLNAKQITAQYLKVLLQTEEHIIPPFYIPFKRLTIEELNSWVWLIQSSIASEKYLEAISSSKELINLGLDGLEYYQNYYQKPLLICISLSYLGWIVYLLLNVFDMGFTAKTSKTPKLNIGFSCMILITCFLTAMQKLPISFYAYFLLPQFLWYFTLKKVWAVKKVIENMNKQKCLYFFAGIMFGVEILVMSFFLRWVLCVSVGIILTWTVCTFDIKPNKYLVSVWSVSGIALAMFSLLPVVGGQPNPKLTFVSSIALSSLALFLFFFRNKNNNKNKNTDFLFWFQLFALVTSAWNNYSVHDYFNRNQELPGSNQVVSWVLLALSGVLLFVKKNDVTEKLHQVFMTLSVPFLLLSITHEGFFLFFLFIHLICWVYIERLSPPKQTLSDFRIAYFFLSYIFLSFFGLGNTSSVNSFDPAWVRCFLTVFSPFLMSALILLKTVIPFLVVTITMRVLTIQTAVRPEKLFVIVLIYCNIMGLNFLFLVRNKGSWLDIGTSISHYVIQQVTIVFLVLLFGIAKILMRSSIQNLEDLRRMKCNRFDSSKKVLVLPRFSNVQKYHNS